MTTQPRTPEEVAREIAGPCDIEHYGHTPKSECCCPTCTLTRAIAAAIHEASKAPPGHILDGGVVRKVLGTLPITADGCVITDENTCSLVNIKGEKLDAIGHGMAWGPVTFCVDTGERCRVAYSFSECYSTREAAEAARAKGGE